MRLRRSDPTSPGIQRRRSGRGFRYLDRDGSALSDEAALARIAGLAIPPAWTDVWISPYPHGHIQALGTDAAGRRQYLYHEAWRAQRDRTKFDRALSLAQSLPAARGVVSKALAGEITPTRDRALAAAFRILDSASLRIGSEQYANDNGSHGLATLLCAHASISGTRVRLTFPAKSGQSWDSELDDPALAACLRVLRGRRSGRLLSWRDGRNWHPLSSSEINDYIRERTRGDFTAKDFRTLHGTIVAAQSLQRTGWSETARARNAAVRHAMLETAAALGNTPAVARSSYVDPRVIDRFEAGELLSPQGAPERALVALLA